MSSESELLASTGFLTGSRLPTETRPQVRQARNLPFPGEQRHFVTSAAASTTDNGALY